jgi:type III secretion system HrpB2-like protein
MTPIAPIVPLDSLAPAGGLPAAGASPVASPELAQKFSDLMNQSTPPAAPAAEGAGNVVSDLLTRQQGALQQVQDEVYGLMQAAPQMTSVELMTATMAVGHDFAVSNFKLQVASSITQGSNKSLQTLLKNQ